VEGALVGAAAAGAAGHLGHTDVTGVAAVALLACLPVLASCLFLQRRLIEGLTAGRRQGLG
jgi:ABC-type glycerol-3-phosphate transport system permease component